MKTSKYDFEESRRVWKVKGFMKYKRGGRGIIAQLINKSTFSHKIFKNDLFKLLSK